MQDIGVSFPLAFAAGVVSFLSPCVLPVVPGYLTFVSGMTLEELERGHTGRARRQAALHAIVFGVGFGLVFMTLGATATALGRQLTPWLPTVTRVGGVVVALFGLHLMGLLQTRWLMRERRVHLASRPPGYLGSLAVGIAFGAGWTPCIGPVLATILFYAGFEATVARGTLLLATYGLGLAVPFVGAALAFNWFLAGSKRIQRWLPWVERGAGAILLALGLLMLSGKFAELTAVLADMGQLFILELE